MCSVLAALADALTIVLIALAVGATHDLVTFGRIVAWPQCLAIGGLAVWAFILPRALRGDYGVGAILDRRPSAGRILLIWNFMCLSLALVALLTDFSDFHSYSWVGFYVTGFFGVLLTQVLLRRTLVHLIESDRVERRKLMIVSVDRDVRALAQDLTGPNSGAEVAAVVKLEQRADADGRANFTPGDLSNAVSWGRTLSIDDVIVLADWSQSGNIDQIVSAFTVLPAAIHVGASDVVGSFSGARISHLGRSSVVSLRGQPLEPAQAVTKRLFDVAVSAFALLLLLPFFALVVLAIRLDSRGPALFLQRRRGYNLRVFQIWKFRTMTAMDDGDHVVQACRNDTRVTRVGRFLRRYNIDELPQLINVLKGEMSLVGPRPHAVAHDKLYETIILQYPRRLNMQPGITGWAQVNGLRGKTETDRDMALRVDYDLHYIDNWSLGLDLYIIALTVLSPRAYRNAH